MILAVPLIVSSVGSNGYSQLAVILAAFGWLGPLFVGFGSAVTERIASDVARPISDQTRATFMTAVSVSGALLCTFALGGAFLLLVRPTGESGHAVFVVAGIATALGVSGGIFDSALLGLQRSYITNLMSFAASLAAVGATVVATTIAPDVGALVLAGLGPVVVARAASGYLLRRVEPGLFGRIGDVAWRTVPRLAGRGLVFAGISFESFLFTDAGLLIVGARLGSSEVAEVALVMRVLPMILGVVGMITVPLWPAFAEAAGDGDVRWIARTGTRAAAFVMGYAAIASVLVVVGGEKIFSLWTGGRISVSFEILLGAGAMIIISSFESVTQTLLFGLGRAGTVAAVLMFRSVVSILLVAVMTGTLGQAAALAGPVVASLLSSAWLLPVLVARNVRAKRRSHRFVELGGPDKN